MTEPALACTACSPSAHITASDSGPIWVKPAGGSAGTTALAIVTPYTSAPALTEIDPTLAGVSVWPEPEADWDAPTVLTPVHAEIMTPPSGTESVSVA